MLGRLSFFETESNVVGIKKAGHGMVASCFGCLKRFLRKEIRFNGLAS
jgi:hypothetical protein